MYAKVCSIETWVPMLFTIPIIKVSNIFFERTKPKSHFRVAQIEKEVETTFYTPHLQISCCALCNVTLFWYMREIRNLCCCEYLLRCVFAVRELEFVRQTIAKRLPGQWLASNSKGLYIAIPMIRAHRRTSGHAEIKNGKNPCISNCIDNRAFCILTFASPMNTNLIEFCFLFSVFKRIEIWMKDFLLRPQNTNINSAILVIFTFIGIPKKKCKNAVCEDVLAARGECYSVHWLWPVHIAFTSLIAIADQLTFAIQHINCIFEYLILFTVSRCPRWPCTLAHSREFIPIQSSVIIFLYLIFSLALLVRTHFLLAYPCFDCTLQLQSTFTHAAAALSAARMHTRHANRSNMEKCAFLQLLWIEKAKTTKGEKVERKFRRTKPWSPKVEECA